ncbi:heavy metal-binding domain-containing protein [Hymenobacter sp. BT730]|uniref:heavy metal-binding domain-containing protein n=1 Tax=Hymenobacter sp. BT730 TaxID=3063332 RepID=UPI0026DFD593|nr:heavy metal-binding domain-containing protein [Hymenobacter sp. BT730]
MLKSIKATAAGLVLVAVSALAACQSEPVSTTAPAAAPTAQVAAYVCPMNCEGSASNKPGKCPVCGMDLEPNPAAGKPAAPATDSL